MTEAWTAGPWAHTSVAGGWDGVREANGQIICTLSLNVPANATLIAAAPDLYEALERATEKLKTFINDHYDPGTDAFACVWQAQIALPKARGEQQ